VITTGRAVPATEPYVRSLGIKAPCILYNGAAIYDFEKEKFLWTAALPHTARIYIKDILDAFPEVGAEILYDERIYVARMNKHVSKHVDVEHLAYTVVESDEVPDGWFKVLFVMDSAIQDQVWDYMMAKGWQDVNFIKSDAIYLEMMPLGVSKGDALLKLAELLGVSPENTVGIGDYNNDIELIEKSALGFAMANAPEDVKAVADVVAVDCDESAIAWAIEYVREHLNTF